VSYSMIPAGKRFSGALLLLLAAAPLLAQTSITSNDGGTGTTGNLYEAVTLINGTANGGSVTLDISGSNSVTLGQALPTVSQSLTFLGTVGTDQTLGITGSTEAESALVFNQNLGLGDGVTLSVLNDGAGGNGNLDSSVSIGGTLSMGVSSAFSLTAAQGSTGTTGSTGSAGPNGVTSGQTGGPGGFGGSGGSGGNGGNASVTAAVLSLTGAGDDFTLTGGTGGTGGSGGVGGFGGVGVDGANGGSFGQSGGNGGSGGSGGAGGVGGNGENASLTATTLSLSGAGDSILVTGGTGGVGGAGGVGGSGGFGGAGGAGGIGGNGGNGGTGGEGGIGGQAGNGGNASVTAGSLSLSGAGDSFTVTGGAGGIGGAEGIGGNGGNGGPGGPGGLGDPSGIGGSRGSNGASGFQQGAGGNGGNAAFTANFLNMGAGTTFTAAGGAGGTGSTNGTAGSAFVTLGHLDGSGTLNITGTTAVLQALNLSSSASISIEGTTAAFYAGSGNFSGVISGDASLIYSGSILSFDGTDLSTGPVSVTTGLFLMGGSNPEALLTGDTVVSAPATLEGRGRILGSLDNNGVVAAGVGSSGTLTVGGYTQAASGTLAIGVSPTQSTALNVQGTAQLAGALTVTASGNFGVKYTYQFLTAWNPLLTKFTSYGYDLPSYLTPSISYGADDVLLTLTRTNADFGVFAQTANEQAVAAALNSAVTSAGGDLLNKMNALYTQPSGQAGVLEQLGGVVYTALPNLTVESAQFQTGLLIDRLEGHGLGSSTPLQAFQWNPGPYADAASSDADSLLKPGESKGYWLEQTDSFGSLSGNSQVSSFNQTGYGLMGGYESSAGDGLVSGFAAGYLHTNLTSQGADGTAGVDNWQGDIYGRYRFESLDLAVVLGYGFNQYQVSRPIGTGIQAAGSFTGNQISAGLELTEHLTAGDLNPVVLAGGQYTYVETAAFTERNADSYDLSVPGANAYSLRPYLGVGLEPKVKTGGLVLEPLVKVTVAQEMLTPTAQQNITLAGAAQSPFNITGVTPGQTIVGAEAGMGLKLDAHLKLYAAYDGTFSSTDNLNTVSGGLNLGF